MTPTRALIEAAPGAMMTDERLEAIYHAATINGMGVSFSSEAVVEIIDRLRNAEAKLAAISSAKAAEEGVETPIQASVRGGKALGKKTLYFGCWNQAGHYLHEVGGRSVYGDRRPTDLPWDECIMDGTLLKNGNVPDIVTGKVYWTCGGKDAFWYAFYWWDRSVDTRGACNSGFYVRGFDYPAAQEAFDWACSEFPSVVARQKFPLELQNPVRPVREKDGL